MNLIKICNLTKSYGKNIIFSNLNLELDSNYIYFLVNENGKGKSTFFKCLLRETNFKGEINDDNLKYIFMPDKIDMPPFLKVYDFLKMFLEVEKQQYNREYIDSLFDRFAIFQYSNYYVDKLSKGTKQKILIIKTILSNSDVFLFDEPFNGLDKKSRCVFVDLLDELYKKDKIIIIATHYFNDYHIEKKKVISLG